MNVDAGTASDVMRAVCMTLAVWVLALLVKLHASHGWRPRGRREWAELAGDTSYAVLVAGILVRRLQGHGSVDSPLSWAAMAALLLGAVALWLQYKERGTRRTRHPHLYRDC